MIELAQQFDVHPNQIKQWEDQLLDGAADVFDDGRKETVEPVVDVKSLHAKIGELALQLRCYFDMCLLSSGLVRSSPE